VEASLYKGGVGVPEIIRAYELQTESVGRMPSSFQKRITRFPKIIGRGTGTWGSKSSGPARHNHACQKQNDATISHDKEIEGSQKPVRGVVLDFATRMRQSRGKEVLLND
jgi:hypothetical protein